ncbi:MAG: hypothetical protein ACRDKZ_06355 [Actinomycetota bacterium]
MESTDPTPTRPNDPDDAPPAALVERARRVVEQGEDASDADRLRLIEDLYGALERELERDLDQIPSTRR